MDIVQKLSLFSLLFALLLTLGTALPVAAQEDSAALCSADSSSCDEGKLICAASVKIGQPTQGKDSPNVVVPYTWETTGTEVAYITIEVNGTIIGPLPYPPDGNENRLIPGTAFDGPGIYWVRITVTTECGASSMFMRPFYYRG